MKSLIKGYGREKKIGLHCTRGFRNFILCSVGCTSTRHGSDIAEGRQNFKIAFTKNLTGGLVITKGIGK
jgi:hypothetical protein